jgi:serine protease Do
MHLNGNIRKAATILGASAVIFATGFFLAGSMPRGIGSVEAQVVDAKDESLPDVIDRVSPSVVYITSKRIVKSRMNNPFLDDPFWRRFFDVPKEREEQNLGSGVVVSRDGYILTNNHLVGGASEVEVNLMDGRRFEAEITGTDPKSDVAVLKIDTSGLPIIPLGKSSELRLGECVIAIGYPFGLGQTVTKGIVSARGRALKLVDYEDFIQTDAAINPGNSGGALINSDGELVGINTAIASRSGGSHGIGFAIPIDFAYSIMNSIIEHGRVVRGYVGIYPQDINHDMMEYFNLDSADGVLVAEVVEGGPADDAGMRQGDVIVEFDGKEVESSDRFRLLAAETAPGSEIEVVVIRGDSRKILELVIGERPEEALAEKIEKDDDISPLFLGVGLETLDNDHREALDIPSDIKGVIVSDVERSTPAADAGIRRGDVIVEINRAKIGDLTDFRELMDGYKKAKVLVVIYRGGGHFYAVIRK